jgi:hypothetical protein
MWQVQRDFKVMGTKSEQIFGVKMHTQKQCANANIFAPA